MFKTKNQKYNIDDIVIVKLSRIYKVRITTLLPIDYSNDYSGEIISCDHPTERTKISFEEKNIVEVVTTKNDNIKGENKMRKIKPVLTSGERRRCVKDIKVINDNNGNPIAVEMSFSGLDKPVKSVCSKDDTFDLEKGIVICLLKSILGSSIQNDATKKTNKLIKDCFALIKEKQEEEIKTEAEKVRIAAKKAKKAAKSKANWEKKKAAERAEKVAIQTEAYIAAIKATGIAPVTDSTQF